MSPSIPVVNVPMNFGIEYLGSPSHGNLKFLLKDDELSANSAIMSFNSPVIKNMTIELFQTEIEVQEFSKDAVLCFLAASYSGILGGISKSNFRDLNKLVHVFKVNWLMDRCFEYFQKLTGTVVEDVFDDQSFLFHEGMFIMAELKSRRFIDIVIKKFTSSLTFMRSFVINYLSDISSCPTKNLEVIMEMTAKDEQVLVEVLVKNLENSTIDENSRYILERLDYMTCQFSEDSRYQRMLELLEEIENPSTADCRLIMRALKQYNKALNEMKDSISYAALPSLFHEFMQLRDIEDLDSLLYLLIESPVVTNSYIFYDAVFSWLFEKRIGPDTPCVTISDNHVEKFSNIVHTRGWKPVSLKYIEKQYSPSLGGLTGKIQLNPYLATINFKLIPSISEYTPEDFFARNHDVKFKYKQDFITNCNKDGDCGFILRITAATGEHDDSFNIRLVIDPSLYPADIHFHRESLTLADKLHFTFDVTSTDEGRVYVARPVSWYGKPHLDGTGKYWCWGACRFYLKGEGTNPQGNNMNWMFTCGKAVKIRPVVYISDNFHQSQSPKVQDIRFSC